jgi:hypothetical protein
MADIESLYKKDNGKILIEIKLTSVLQLFNSFDPAPFHEKELDSAAENYIVETVKDFPPKTLFKISPPRNGHRRFPRQYITILNTRCWFQTGNSVPGSGTGGPAS